MSLLTDEESTDAASRILSRIEKRTGSEILLLCVHFSVEEEEALVRAVPVKGKEMNFRASSKNNFRSFRLR